MKTVSVITCATILFFAVGVASVLLMPNAAKAGPGGPGLCDTSHCGTKDVCGGQETCMPAQAMHYTCRQWNPPLMDCDGPWTCGCRATGCGDLCYPGP